MARRSSRATPLVAEDDPGWLAFWGAFPRREAKLDARKAWVQKQPPLERVLEALAWQVPLHQWDGEKHDFCPLPASWLRGERWTDEQPPPVDRRVAERRVGERRRPAWAQGASG